MGILGKTEDIFKPASKGEIEDRRKDFGGLTADMLDDIDVIRSIYEDNIGKKVSDEKFAQTVGIMLRNSNKTIDDLKQLNDSILGMLIALDDAALDLRGIQETK